MPRVIKVCFQFWTSVRPSVIHHVHTVDIRCLYGNNSGILRPCSVRPCYHVRSRDNLLLVWFMVSGTNTISQHPILGSDTGLFFSLWTNRTGQNLHLCGNLSFIADYFLTLTVAVICQAVVTLRVWHLFLHSCFIRRLAVTVFIICAVGAVIVTSVEFDAMKRALCASSIAEIFTQGPLSMFTVYLPALVVHTVMLLLTMYRFRVSPKALQQRGIMHRFVKEGIFMYTFATGSLLYEIICLSMTESKDISIYYPSLIGGQVLLNEMVFTEAHETNLFPRIAISTTAVSVCRAMLSIKSFAVTYHVDPAWLLNHAELSRVQWRRGASEGEIFVESGDMEADPPSKLLGVSAGRTEGEWVV
ncbi:uncharacterized protein HD556DRAFT_278216 [Suillus plorans]|uniref:Uncharacterized protein n=1 Tax=Suillus plorans TaxID=116603 RepID=A0A9P7ATR5_9AGAM|nr:uncharacterized protein HD556DRAFT_278216 [Suillus plorans]KAG1796643.1 hypothetical protein HD556DRAFT_278216 [Suillus plorans]